MATPVPVPPAAPSGLPQFDPQWWPGQIFWFLVVFAVVYALMRYVFVPRIGGTIDSREAKIEGDIAGARRLRDEADAQAKAAAAETAQARAEAKRVAGEARAKAQAGAAARMAEEEAKLNETIEAAEARIRAARDGAMSNVRGIAADAAGAIIARLTGTSASAAEIDAALAGQA